MIRIFLFVVCLVPLSGYVQNIQQIGFLDYQSLHGFGVNDLWGYVDEFGNEYALVGTNEGLSVVDVSDPSNPSEIYFRPGVSSNWRDVKVYNDYAYVTTEALTGLLIIDLSPLPGNANLTTYNYTGPFLNSWKSAHNIFIDENGVAYIFGANRGNKGVIMLDLNTDPTNPSEIGTVDNWYTHDGFARGDTLYLAHINDGFFSVFDISNKSTPVLLTTFPTPSEFTHNVWLSDNGNYLYTTDETYGGYIGVYDISDLQNISETDRVRTHSGDNFVPHNTFYLNEYLITSYYSDGVIVHDVSDPNNVIEVAQFDSSPYEGGNYHGCWGVYPFLPSGNVLMTDREQGLYILSVDYQRAAKIQGVVRNSNTSVPIGNVQVSILGSPNGDKTDIGGVYQTGVEQTGSYDVAYFHPAYFPDTIYGFNLVSGQTIIQDVYLVEKDTFSVLGNIKEANGGPMLADGIVQLKSDYFTYYDSTDINGHFEFHGVYPGDYTITSGKWGWYNKCLDYYLDSNFSDTITLEMYKGYFDDFTFDMGWIEVSNVTSGKWERGEPILGLDGAGVPVTPGADVSGNHDCNNMALLTGASTGVPDEDDVDNGVTQITSPIMDLTGYTDPYLNYSKWFYNFYGPFEPDDTLSILLSNGTSTVLIDSMTYHSGNKSQWVDISIRILDHVSLTNSMTVKLSISDFQVTRNVTEAGFDRMIITEGNSLYTNESFSIDKFIVFPNPGSSRSINILTSSAQKADMFTIDGIHICTFSLNKGENHLDINVSPGVYIIRNKMSYQKVILYE